MKVAIVTFEFEGLTKNGGIGTAYRRMAELLVRDGHKVTVVFMPFNWPKAKPKNFARSLEEVERRGIKVVFAERTERLFFVKSDGFHVRRSLLVYDFLRTRDFDFVHAPDNCGLVYFSLLAKKSRMSFARTQFVIGAHGSPLWTAQANGQYSESAVLLSHFDRRSLAMADHVVSPSAYMLQYIRSLGWKVPPSTHVIPNANFLDAKSSHRLSLLGGDRRGNSNASRVGRKQIRLGPKTLVFFGRLERRKGAYLFTEAIELLLEREAELGVEAPLKIVFLGSQPEVARRGSPIVDLIRNRLDRFAARIELQFVKDLTSAQSIEFLKRLPFALVCMPSLVDNSPYVIMEAIEFELDFLATRSGGQAELIHPADRRKVLCAPTAIAWAEGLHRRLSARPQIVRPSAEALRANSDLLKFHKRALRQLKTPRVKVSAQSAKISVVLGLNQSGVSEDILLSLSALLRQDYANIELCLASNLVPNTFKWRRGSLRLFEAGTHDAHSVARKIARGKYILFLDGAELREPTILRQWVRAAEAIGATSRAHIGFSGIVDTIPLRNKTVDFEDWNVPLPDEPTRAALGQCIGSAYALWNRARFNQLAAKVKVNLANDLAARPFFAAALASGWKSASLPILVGNTLRPDWGRNWDADNQVSILEPFLRSLHSDSAPLLLCAAGLYRELNYFRDGYYDQQIKIEASERMRAEILRQVR